MTESKDTLGDRLKAQERVEAGRKADKRLPLICRLDGKAFHTFTRGLQRPYEARLSELMVDTTRYLVEHTHANVGYTQSDEITLIWIPKYEDSFEYMYDGKFQKLTSILASMAAGYFNAHLATRLPEKSFEQTGTIAAFDARVWNVPNVDDAYLNLLWRQNDAIKNSISMAAQAHFSHKSLHGVGSEEKKKMLREIGKPWEDEPMFFKMGTFVGRRTSMVELSPEQLAKIPEKHRPTGPVQRTSVVDLKLGYLEDYDEPLLMVF